MTYPNFHDFWPIRSSFTSPVCLSVKKTNEIGYKIRKNSGLIVLELAIEFAEHAVNLFKDIYDA